MKLASTPHERTIDVDISSDGFWARSFEERDGSTSRVKTRHGGRGRSGRFRQPREMSQLVVPFLLSFSATPCAMKPSGRQL